MSNSNAQNFFMNPSVAGFMPQLQNPMAPFSQFPCQQNPLLNPNLKFPPFFQQTNMLPGYGDFPPQFRGLYGNPRKMTSSDHHDDGEPDDAKAEVENQELWQKFSDMNTEMVITKTGRLVKNN